MFAGKVYLPLDVTPAIVGDFMLKMVKLSADAEVRNTTFLYVSERKSLK